MLVSKIMSVVDIKNECNVFFFVDWNRNFHTIILIFFLTDKTIEWYLLEWSFVHDMGAIESILGWIVRSMQSFITTTYQKFNGKSTKISGEFSSDSIFNSFTFSFDLNLKKFWIYNVIFEEFKFYLFISWVWPIFLSLFSAKNHKAMAFAAKWWGQ